MPDRAQLVREIADACLETGRLPWAFPEGCTAIKAELSPQGTLIRFAFTWPDQVLVTSRSLAGYSLDGGLHRTEARP